MFYKIKKFTRFSKIFMFVIFLALTIAKLGFSQHRGDPLAFQGLSNEADYGIMAMAMGNAYTSISGELGALYFNPAGLASINKFKVSVSANTYHKKWQENQVYRPNRFLVHLPFYLDGLYVPSSLNVDSLTGEPRWDNDIAIDSNYVVNQPDLGLGSFSEEAADWIKEVNNYSVNTFSAAFPLKLFDRNFVLSFGYKNRYNVLDFDRNDTYLDPHIGFSKYNMPDRVIDGDTLIMNWYNFLRKRIGNLHQSKLAVGFELNENIQLGLGFSMIAGETNDIQSFHKVGYFEITDNNIFRFGFDSLDTELKGTSQFNSVSFDLGGIYEFDKLSLGVVISLPQTLTRNYEYKESIADTNGLHTRDVCGEDKFKIPATYTVGFNFRPVEKFIFSVDYRSAKYSTADFELADATADSSHNQWVDQAIFRCGIVYKPAPFLSLMAGYQYLPQTFVPDGAAFKDRGPEAVAYTIGSSISLYNLGCINIAYKIHKLKYYDQYMSNTNYNLIKHKTLAVEYIFSF